MKNFIRRSVSVILTAVLIFGVFVFHTSAVDGETSGITDGRIYYIINSNSGKALDVSAGNTADNSDVSQYTYTFGTYWQEWRIRYVGNGDYTIEDMHSRKLITNINDDAKISSANGSDSQKFRIVRNSNGTYTFMSKSSGYTKSLGIYQSGTANGDTLRVLDNDSSANQKFTLRAEKTYGITDGFIYSLINVGDGQAVDIPGGATATGTYACKYTFSSMNPWQRFKVQLLDDGDCNLVDMNSGKLLSIVGSSANNGANAWIYDYDGTDGQKFRIQRTSDGTYTIYSKCSNYKMALGWNGVNLVQLAEDGSNNQKFRLVLAGCVYNIQNARSLKSLNPTGGGVIDQTDVSQYEYISYYNLEQWVIEYVGGEQYEIMDRHSGKLLSIYANSSDENGNASLWYDNDSSGQRFKILYNEDDTVTFLSASSSYTKALCIYSADGGQGLANGDTVVQQSYDPSSSNQRFILHREEESAVPEGEYYFKNTATSMYMQRDNQGDNFCEQHNYDGDSDQLWDVQYSADGYYTIVNQSNGLLLTVQDNFDPNKKVLLSAGLAGTDTYRQRWKFTVTEYGELEIQSRYHSGTNFVVAVGDGSGEGVNVEHRNNDVRDRWIAMSLYGQKWKSDSNSAGYWNSPMKIYKEYVYGVNPSSEETTWSEYFDRGIETAINQWGSVLDVSFNMESNKTYANTLCYAGKRHVLNELYNAGINGLTMGLTKIETKTNTRTCIFDGAERSISQYMKVTIYIVASENENKTKSVTTHEFGHALGYNGHSLSQDDVMLDGIPEKFELTYSDKHHLKQIYDYFK